MNDGQDGGDPAEQPNEVDVRQLADLQLIRAMQEELQVETKALEEIRSRDGWTAAERQRARALAERQGELSKLLQDLLSRRDEDE